MYNYYDPIKFLENSLEGKRKIFSHYFFSTRLYVRSNSLFGVLLFFKLFLNFQSRNLDRNCIIWISLIECILINNRKLLCFNILIWKIWGMCTTEVDFKYSMLEENPLTVLKLLHLGSQESLFYGTILQCWVPFIPLVILESLSLQFWIVLFLKH